ncbi:MAG: peptidase S41 [Bacteroidetes bacterium]|nr:peptidase S41 [Rhodothermaceae bacterium RA]RMH60071.1 MAG: peptidase S41 [Bacteroidota bacterium]
MRRCVLCLLAVLLAAPAALAQTHRPFLRHPAVSPDGSQIAFSFQGDVWTVPIEGGRAYRLTVHEAYDAHPRWSPDGTQIAFASDRFGHDDLFVMDAAGGPPRRLTFHSADDLPTDWTRDGRLLFETRRTFAQVEREREIYHVAPTGGTPDRLLDALGYRATRSPDGRYIAFERGSNGTERKHYRGPANRDLWLFDTQTDTYTRLTTFEGNDYHPVWTGDRTLLFISERDGTYNLYRATLGPDGTFQNEPEALTAFSGDGVRTVSASADGRRIAFEYQTDVYVLDLPDRTPRRLDVQVPADYRFDPVERRTFTRQATEYAVSPGGDYVAFVVRGELFLMENDPEGTLTVRLTDHPYRDQDVAWLNDSTLVFASDRAGQYDLYRLESADPNEPDLFKTLQRRTIRLTDTPEDERRPVVAPDGRHVAFLRGRGTLLVAAVDGDRLGPARTLLDGWATPDDLAWSPDSRWLAYALDDLQFNREIFIHAADGSRPPVNVSLHPDGDGSPVWSPDGSKLGFISDRSSGDADVWFVWLRQEDWEKTRSDWEELDEDDDANDREDGTANGDDAPPPIEIDFERIHERLVRVTALPGNESNLAISTDGDTFFFVAGQGGRTQDFDTDVDLYRIGWDGRDLERMTQGGQAPGAVRLGPDGKHLFMMRSGGQIARIATGGGSPETLSFAARMTIDHEAERGQIFDEAWRALDQGFYDPHFHGVDWAAMRAKYRPWALSASTDRDFRDVFNLMLGELNASHLGLYGDDRAETQNEQTGLLGLELDPVEDGVRIVRVVPDSPADRTASKLLPGEVIVGVDGERVADAPNFYQLLTDKVDRRTLLTVRAADGAERTVVIRPTASLRDALYEEWVRERRRLTDAYSGGRLGYIHVQGMNWPSFERFERELVASGEGKDGLLIDVRFNGGGWTTDYLLAVLNVPRHAYTIPRGAAADPTGPERTAFRPHYPFGERLPLAAWTRPVAALCNQNSYSNAEIFSHAFKNLGLGPLIGTPTFGAVISTGGVGLIDGSFVRLPFRGWFVYADDRNMENGPAVPDVIVENPPDAKARGEDPQLRAAVETLLRQIDAGEANRPAPSAPGDAR